VNTLQAWLIVGVPALVFIAGAFAGRSPVRAAAGYLLLAATFVFFLVVPRDPVSAGAIGAIGFFLVALGRGTTEVEAEEEDYRKVPFRVDDPNVDEPRRV
jgi:hypothetical protein